eukprot:PITA_10523
MQKEYDALIKNDTWKLVDPPFGTKQIGCKWVYKNKYEADGSLDKQKARLVAKGFAMKGHEHKVCKLVKSLYGLKQAPRAWYEKLNEHLLKLNFNHFDLDDATLFVKKVGKTVVYLVVYVDDLLMKGNNESYIASIKKELGKSFGMTDLGYVHYYLGIEVTQHPKSIFLSQKKYIGDLLNRFMQKPCEGHWSATKRVLKYLKGTQGFGIKYTQVEDFSLIRYSDSDFDGDKETGVSTLGYAMGLGSRVVS